MENNKAIEVLYYWKNRFSNEPYCPLCSKELYSTGFHDKERDYFYKSDFVYCPKCKTTFIYEKIYFALKKIEPEFRLVNRKECESNGKQ